MKNLLKSQRKTLDIVRICLSEGCQPDPHLAELFDLTIEEITAVRVTEGPLYDEAIPSVGKALRLAEQLDEPFADVPREEIKSTVVDEPERGLTAEDGPSEPTETDPPTESVLEKAVREEQERIDQRNAEAKRFESAPADEPPNWKVDTELPKGTINHDRIRATLAKCVMPKTWTRAAFLEAILKRLAGKKPTQIASDMALSAIAVGIALKAAKPIEDLYYAYAEAANKEAVIAHVRAEWRKAVDVKR
jgi:hypothetical protein